jgi:hypothetical protein
MKPAMRKHPGGVLVMVRPVRTAIVNSAIGHSAIVNTAIGHRE